MIKHTFSFRLFGISTVLVVKPAFSILFICFFLFFYGCKAPQTIKNDSISFIVIGDWGNNGNKKQKLVAQSMDNLAAKRKVDFIISTGDNFYSKGVDSKDDSLWQIAYQQVYNLPYIKDLDWYVVLGNHDYQGNYKAQLDYSRVDNNWILPNNYYSKEKFADNFTAKFIFADTNPLKKSYWEKPDTYRYINEQDTAAQLHWLDSTLTSSTANWNIVIGHHPVYSSGKHGSNDELINSFKPLFNANGVQAYFAGHEHDLQHQKPVGSVHYFISGAGAKTRPTGKNKDTSFSTDKLGFAYVTLTSNELKLEFIDADGKTIYKTVIMR